MVLDPVTAIGLAGNIVQFVDFSSKVVISAVRIYRADDGNDTDVLDVVKIFDDFQGLHDRIESSLQSPKTKDDDQLVELGKRCLDISNELVSIFKRLSGRYKSWNSFRTALKMLWKKDAIEALQTKLAGLREQLQLHALVDLRHRLIQLGSDQAQQYELLDTRTQQFLRAVVDQRNVFPDTVKAQIDELKDLQRQSRVAIATQNAHTRSILSAESQATRDILLAEHEVTRSELQNSMAQEAAMLKRQMEQIEASITSTIGATSKPNQKMIQQSNALHASWYAKDVVYSDLMEKLDTRQLADFLARLLINRDISGHHPSAAHSTAPEIVETVDVEIPDKDLIPEVLGANSQTWTEMAPLNKNFLQDGQRHLGLEDIPEGDLPCSLKLALANRFTRTQIRDWEYDMKLALNSVEPFFFVGAFLFPAILRLRISGSSLEGIAKSMTPADLYGYQLHVVRDAAFPALYPCGRTSSVVHGMLAFGLRDSQRQNLHDFQSGMFDVRFESVRVRLGDWTHMTLKARCYVWNGSPDALLPVEEAVWSAATFMQTDFYHGLAQTVSVEEELLQNRVVDSYVPKLLLINHTSTGPVVVEERRACEQCFSTFKSSQLAAHVKAEHGSGRFKCHEGSCIYEHIGFSNAEKHRRHLYIAHQAADRNRCSCNDFTEHDLDTISGPNHERTKSYKASKEFRVRQHEVFFRDKRIERIQSRPTSPGSSNHEGANPIASRMLLQMVKHLDNTEQHRPQCLLKEWQVHVKACAYAFKGALRDADRLGN